MSLTINGGPLAGHAAQTVNYRIDGPAHRLLLTEFPRRVRAVLGDVTVADTRQGRLLHETGLLPVLYLPMDDLRTDLLEPTEHTTHCPFKGDATYWSIRVGDRLAENAVWAYPEPMKAAAWLTGYAALYWSALDAWFDEDEPVHGHLRDPYHRVDARRTHRRVRVHAGGRTLAETDRPVLLSETGLPNRLYIPRDDVRLGLLERSDTQTVCPYKGTASYWSLRTDDGLLADVAWSYPEPLDGVRPIEGQLCFVHDAVTIDDETA